eukprot:COSAG02_NODE_2915_length_7755_cov_3.080329_3_plen_1240_part_00
MSEPVPHNWKEMYDEQGYPYYVNQINGKTSRRHPSDAFYNQLVKYEKIRELTEGPRQEIGAWMDFTDFDGSTYYYNFEINMSSSHRPHFGLQNKRLIDRLKLEATIELEHYVATKIQSMWRRHLVKKIVRDRKREVDAAITIQRTFRRYINRDLDKRRKMAQIHSARRIQAHYRGRMARKQVKEMASSREQHVAATRIQATFRGRKARRMLVEPYVRRIQANWRGYMARKIILPLMKDRKLFASVVKVQTAWRAKAERTAVGRKYQDQKRKWAAKKVQAHWRGFVTRVEYERMLEEEYEDRAAENAEKKKAKLEELRTRAAITIQSSWKTYKSRQFLKTIQAVLTMQRRRRDTQEIRNAREQLNQIRTGNKMKSALILQRYWRGHCGRRWITEQRARAVAAIVKQAAQRRDVKRNLLRKQEQAATVIANRVRQRIAKQRLAVMKATLRLQTIFRSCRARKLYLHLRAAIVLQSLCRLHAARTEATQLRRMGAIVHIQQCWRGFVGRETVMLVRRRIWAAVTVQRAVRGLLTRRLVQDLRLQRCAVYIQKAWRGKAARLKYFDALNMHWEKQHRQREHDAAAVLQARWRGRMERRIFSSQLAEHRDRLARVKLETSCAVLLQTLVRKHRCRAVHLQRLEDIRRDAAAVSIQKWWRGIMAKRVVQLAREARDLQVRTDAAVMVQKNWRRHSCMRKYKTTLVKRNESILYMQSLWRMKQARRERQRRVLFNTAVKLQARYRGKQARRRADALRREQELENRCAVILQVCCRCFVDMQAFDTQRLHVAAAVSIQSTWRRHKAQCQYRLDLAEHNARSTAGMLLQALCRMSISRDDFERARELRNQEIAAVRIQASWRAKLTRRWFAAEADRLREEYRQNVIAKMVSSYEHKIEVIEAAAVRVQKHFRGVTARRRVVKQRQRRAAIVIQKNVRGLLSRKQVLRLLSARYDWMLVSSLLLDAPGQRDADLCCLSHFSQQMLIPLLNPQVRRFAWLMKIKQLCATLIQKIARGRRGRRLAISSLKCRVDRLSFGPELRRLRSSLPSMAPTRVLSSCLYKMEALVVKKHDLEAAKYVQRCYRGRLGRRFMRVLRGHSNMNRIRRVMMPIVLRTGAPTETSRGFRESVREAGAHAHSVTRGIEVTRTRDVLVQPRNSFVSLGSMIRKAQRQLPNEGALPRLAHRPAPSARQVEPEYPNPNLLVARSTSLPPVHGRHMEPMSSLVLQDWHADAPATPAIQTQPTLAWAK